MAKRPSTRIALVFARRLGGHHEVLHEVGEAARPQGFVDAPDAEDQRRRERRRRIAVEAGDAAEICVLYA